MLRNVITSLRCLPEYGVLISGCKNGRVNIWDVSTLKLIRLLAVHGAEITDLKACWITGDIFVASSRQISVYSINGDPLGTFFLYYGFLFVFRICSNRKSVVHRRSSWSRMGAPANRAFRPFWRRHPRLGTRARSLPKFQVFLNFFMVFGWFF